LDFSKNGVTTSVGPGGQAGPRRKHRSGFPLP
jgi:hypothetical protein